MLVLPVVSSQRTDSLMSPDHPTGIRLRLENVIKTYFTDGQPVHALNGVSLSVRNGEFVALVGRSGCGKSTLLNLAGAMDSPTSGTILLDGVSTVELDDNGLTQLRREKVGFIFQSFQLLNTLSVLENVDCHFCWRANPTLERGRKRNLTSWSSTTSARACRTNSLADRCSGWRLRARWCISRSCCWRMSLRETSTQRRATSFSGCYDASHQKRTQPS